MKRTVNILECTLRDGSYRIDYQFTAEDTYLICLGLRRSGFKYVEIGHGTGLGSSRAARCRAAATDEAYLRAASAALAGSDTQYGMFFIPGIGRMEDIEMAVENGISFIRIGTDVTDVGLSKRFIEKAKSLGLLVFSNLMKSYAVPVARFVELACQADAYGSDVIVLVDSAGCMLPRDVKDYTVALAASTGKLIGFHGHNNLQFAVANSVEAAMSGARFVDSSLQGMGRSAGNAQTEVLVAVLEELDYVTGIDLYRAMDIGNRLVRPMMSRAQGVDDVSIISGMAKFHSGFMDLVSGVADRYGVDLRQLIRAVGKVGSLKIKESAVRKEARAIARKSSGAVLPDNCPECREVFRSGPSCSAESVTDELVGLSRKSGLESVFSVTLSRSGNTSYPFIRRSRSMIIGNCEVSCMMEMGRILEHVDGRVDWVLLDRDAAGVVTAGLERKIKRSNVAWYSEQRLLLASVSAMLSEKVCRGRVLVFAPPAQAVFTAAMLEQQGISVLSDAGRICEADAVVSFGKEFSRGLSATDVKKLRKSVYIFAAVPDAFPRGFWEAALLAKRDTCRVDTSAGLVAEMTLAMETRRIAISMGRRKLGSVPVVSGGMIGKRGDVVVDSVTAPLRIIGIANGKGGLLPAREEVEFSRAVERVREYLINTICS